jgi:hypothetical protein
MSIKPTGVVGFGTNEVFGGQQWGSFPDNDKGGGGDGTITTVESTDGSVVVTNPTGPVVDLSAPAVKTIESTDGSIIITNPSGPTTNLKVAGATPPVVGFSWLSTQLARASLVSTALDTPWYTDLIINPGKNLGGQDIEFSLPVTGSGSATAVATKPGGVYLLDTGASASSTAGIGTPNSGSFIVQNPSAGPFYLSSRILAVAVSGAGQLYAVQALNSSNNEAVQLVIALNGGGIPVWVLLLSTAAGTTIVHETSPSVDLANAHDMAVGFDGTTVTAYQDGTPIPGLSTTDLSHLTNNTLSMGVEVLNLTTAASQQMYVDKVCAIQRSIQ